MFYLEVIPILNLKAYTKEGNKKFLTQICFFIE